LSLVLDYFIECSCSEDKPPAEVPTISLLPDQGISPIRGTFIEFCTPDSKIARSDPVHPPKVPVPRIPRSPDPLFYVLIPFFVLFPVPIFRSRSITLSPPNVLSPGFQDPRTLCFMFLSSVPPIPRSPDPSVKKFHNIAEDIAGARSSPHPTQK